MNLWLKIKAWLLHKIDLHKYIPYFNKEISVGQYFSFIFFIAISNAEKNVDNTLKGQFWYQVFDI